MYVAPLYSAVLVGRSCLLCSSININFLCYIIITKVRLRSVDPQKSCVTSYLLVQIQNFKHYVRSSSLQRRSCRPFLSAVLKYQY